MRFRLPLASLAALLAAALLAPAAAQARDAIVPSFDGAPIIVSFFPAAGLAPGQKAPTILETHGWAGSRETNPDAGSSEQTGNVGVGPLRRAGFNVLTWDSRGFGDSGGTVEVDSKDFEGRDVQALIDWLAKQPEARLDAPGDPRVGMHGVSYAGGIELVAAGIDPRIDAIAPTIAWHSLLTSLYKEQIVKGGWASALYAAGVPSANLDGLDSPAGPQTGGLDPHIASAFSSGASSGHLSDEDRDWFASRGPGDALVSRIRVPTLLVQGTADTLFTLREATENYALLKAHGVPAKMVWFCGGHGVCLTGSGPAGHIEGDVIAWMRHYLAGDASVATGPAFEWLADDAVWRSGSGYPLPAGTPLRGTGAGTLAVNPGDAGSGTPVAAGPAANAVSVPVTPPTAPRQLVGTPKLTFTYSGTGSQPAGHVFAQVVDEQRHVVVGNQVTPIPVTLDGRAHTVSRPLEAIAASAPAGARYTLQITGGSQVYGPVRVSATLALSAIRIALPTVRSAAAPRRSCAARSRFALRLREPRRARHDRLRSARVTVNGRRARVRRRHGRLVATIDLRRAKPGSRAVVRVVARTRKGRTLRERHVYRVCRR